MLLALDIGNTEISLGLFGGEDLERSWRVTTRPDRTPDEWAMVLRALFDEAGLDITSVTGTVLCSVVPPTTDAMAEGLLTATGTAAVVVTRPWGAGAAPLLGLVAKIGQSFPPAAVLAVLVPVLGFGAVPTLVALFVYGLLPVVEKRLK